MNQTIKRIKMENRFYGISIVSFVLIGIIGYIINFSHTEYHTVVVNKVEMLQDISKVNDNIKTEYKCMVYTDEGAFEIEQEGVLFAHPELIGNINVGDTLNIETRGYEIVACGQYRKIVKVN